MIKSKSFRIAALISTILLLFVLNAWLSANDTKILTGSELLKAIRHAQGETTKPSYVDRTNPVRHGNCRLIWGRKIFL